MYFPIVLLSITIMLLLQVNLIQPAGLMINRAMTCLRREGFEGSDFTDESDRPIVTLKITTTYGSVEAFNTRIITIVESILPGV